MTGCRKSDILSAEAAAIGAIYVVLTVLFAPLSYGEVQIRFSEALTILPFFTPAAIPGLFVGCIIANLFGGAIPVDIIFGSIATLIGAVFTYKLRNCNRFLAPIPLMMLTVGVGEVVSCAVIGLILQTALLKYKNVIFRSQRTM